MNTEEFLENLLYSALYPRVYRWRRSTDASQPPDSVLRVFVRMELRLQHRYGFIELERLAREARMSAVARSLRGSLEASREQRLWSQLTPRLIA